MTRERVIVASGAAVLIVLLLAAAVVPGAVADRDADVRPGHLSLQRDVAVAPADVTGETATLSLDVRLAHAGSPVENVTVEVRAIDDDSNLLTTTERVDVGRIEAEGETPVTVNVTVPREGDYRFEVSVYRDEKRVGQGTTTVRGVGSLTPAYAETTVEFERFGDAGVPTISYAIANVSDGRVRLATATHLTNVGDDAVSDLQLVVLARQAESNVVADRRRVTVSEIRPGRTATVDVDLTVPDDYNYRLDALLQRDGVLLGVASANAQLAPSQPMPENVTRREIDIRASDFEGGGEERATPTGPQTTGAAGPGFGAAVALLAVLTAALVLGRYGR